MTGEQSIWLADYPRIVPGTGGIGPDEIVRMYNNKEAEISAGLLKYNWLSDSPGPVVVRTEEQEAVYREMVEVSTMFENAFKHSDCYGEH